MLLLYIALWLLGVAVVLQAIEDTESGVRAYAPDPFSGSTAGTPSEYTAFALPFLGINVALEQYPDSDARQDRLRTLKAQGFGWTRQRLDWGNIEPQPGIYNWLEADTIIRDIRASGLEPVIVLDGSPAWARASVDTAGSGNPLAPPADYASFARFAGAFAARYAEDVLHYQIWDEPNIAPHWGNRWINPVEYAQLLRLTSAAIRQADPDSVILLAALAPTADNGHLGIDEIHFLERLYATGAEPYFDVVAIQPFGFGRTPEDPTQRLDVLNFHRALLVRRTMIAAGDGGTPILAARYGWNRRIHSPWGTVSRTAQNEFAVRSLDIAYGQWPWLVGMGWAVDQPSAGLDDPMWGFSLTDELAETIADWNGLRVPRESLLFSPVRRDWIGWMAVVAVAAIAGWRMIAAARLLPWRELRSAWLRRSVAPRAAVWGILLIVYYFAVWPPLVVLCWLSAALLILAQPATGLWLAAATLPFYFQHKELDLGNQTLAVAPSLAASLCLLPALLLRAAGRRRLVNGIDRWDWLALGWITVIGASATGVWHWPAYWRGVLELAILPLTLFLAVRAFARSPQDRRQVLASLVAGGTLMALAGLLGWLQGGGTAVDSVRRLTGSYYSANHAALYLVRTLFVSVGLAAYLYGAGRRLWLLCAVATSILAIALILTASRGALLLGLPAGLSVLGLYAINRTASYRRLSKRTALILALIIAATVLTISITLPWDRLSNSATIVQRWRLWERTLDLWRDYWLAGVGPHGFFWRFPTYIPVGSSLDPNLQHPHNVWLETVSIGGALALVWFVAAVALVAYAVGTAGGDRRKSPGLSGPAAGVLAALTASLAHAQVDAFAALPDLAQWNWMALGILAGDLAAQRHTPVQSANWQVSPDRREQNDLTGTTVQ